ncbi:hypothetical protein MKW92_032850, partial [Papaver armeniacum]
MQLSFNFQKCHFLVSLYSVGVISTDSSSSLTHRKQSHAVGEEVESLLKWKSTLGNQTRSFLRSWKRSSTANTTSPCKWYGINCNNEGSVAELNLTSSNLEGTLHSLNFSSFPNCVSLDLSSNKLFGFIPSQIGNLSKLTYIDFSMNNLSGHLPAEIGFLTNMSSISISENQISGPIPISLYNLRHLKLLYLYQNQLSGVISQEIGKLTSLVDLQLSSNNLIGPIPTSIGNLSNLNTLYLNQNQLSGTIPQEVGRLTFLSELTLYSNNLIGPIPTSIGNLSNLYILYFHDNHLSGTIPHEIGKLNSLVELVLAINNLTGLIPTSICNLSSLKLLHLSENRLSGNIPLEIGRLRSLTSIQLYKNNLTGPLPVSIWNLTNLRNLGIFENNHLSGTLPRDIGRLEYLIVLEISTNNFTGSIPISLYRRLDFNLRSYLDLSQNELTGEIPSDFGKLNKLINLDLSHNKLSVLIPSSFNEMLSLTNVDISYNELSGPIPNIKAFRDAAFDALKNNSGLCGNHSGGFKPCNFSVMNGRKMSKPSLAVIILVPLRAKNLEKADQPTPATNPRKNIFSVQNYDGKLVFQEIIEATEYFDTKYCIGTGGYGSVYKRKLHSSDEDSEIVDLKSFESEVQALTEIRHKNIVKLLGFCSSIERKISFLIYEFVERGSLKRILCDGEQAVEFDWIKRIRFIKGTADALAYMHHDCIPAIVHRDISSNNVLLDFEYEARVSDFGTARMLKPDSSNWTSLAGTYGYVAP